MIDIELSDDAYRSIPDGDDDPSNCHCGHIHDGDDCPDRSAPCGDYRCCIN